MSRIAVLPSPEALHDEAAERFREAAVRALAERGRFAVALSGGSTPKGVYAALGKLGGVPWEGVHLFWGDERCVPPDRPDSNFGMAWAALSLELPHEQVHRMRGELGPEAGAAAYAAELEVFFDGPAVFDLVHLGLGPDGHIASLFPGQATLEADGPVVSSFPNEGLSPQVARISLSLPAITAARAVQFLVTGEAKADVVARTLEGDPGLPAGRVRGDRVSWLLDGAAARGLSL